MNCRECLDLLDGLEPPLPIPKACRDHAASCLSCALALRLEETLRAAPAWAELPRLSPESRAKVLGRAHVGRIFWERAASLLGDAALTALMILLSAVGLWFVLPSLLDSLLPAPVRQAAAGFLQPVSAFLTSLFGGFAPIVHQPLGAAFVGLSVFAVLLAAVLSVRTFSPALRSAA